MTAKTINYAGNQTIDNSEMVTQKIKNSTNAVNERLAAEIERSKSVDSALTSATASLGNEIGTLGDLQTKAKDNLVNAINELREIMPVTGKIVVDGIEYIDIDSMPAENSPNVVRSHGVWTHGVFEGAKVGYTMYWPVSKKEVREVLSDRPFTFTVNGKTYTTNPADKTIELVISDNVPEGWHALDGTTELDAAEYSTLAEFMPDNVTIGGKIWLPYVKQRIIKVKY